MNITLMIWNESGSTLLLRQRGTAANIRPRGAPHHTVIAAVASLSQGRGKATSRRRRRGGPRTGAAVVVPSPPTTVRAPWSFATAEGRRRALLTRPHVVPLVPAQERRCGPHIMRLIARLLAGDGACWRRTHTNCGEAVLAMRVTPW